MDDIRITQCERGLVGLMILDPSLIDRCEIDLHGYQFIDLECNQVWPIFAELRKKHFPFDDMPALGAELKQRGVEANVLISVYRDAGVLSQETYYLSTMLDARKRMKLAIALKQALDAVQDPLAPYDSQIEQVAAMASAGGMESASRKTNAGQIMLEVVKASELGLRDVRKVETGIAKLDSKLGGFRDKQLIVLAARPSVGKSALAAQMAINAAKCGVRTLFVSLEMSDSELVSRALAHETGIPMQAILDGEVYSQNVSQLKQIATHYQTSIPLFIEDRSNMTLRRLVSLVKQYGRKERLGLVVVDYLQLLRVEGKRQKWEEIEEVSQGLKQLAKSESVPILAVAQLNRDSEKETSKKEGMQPPSLSQLRGSGAIEQDADVILFLHRQHRSSKDADLILAKGRNAGVGVTKLEYNAPKYEFVQSITAGSENEYANDFATN